MFPPQTALRGLVIGLLVLCATVIPTNAAPHVNLTRLEIFSVPEEVARSDAYQVRVRSWAKDANRDWQSLDLFHANVNEVKETTGRTVSYNTSVGLFDFSGPIELSIEPSQVSFPSIDAVRVRPLSYGLQAYVSGRNITLNLTEPANLVVEVNGDVFNVLHLFLDKTGDDTITEDQAKQDSSIIYYGPGYHELEDTVNVTSGQTIYLASGSVVLGGFNFQNTSNAAILGRGVLYKSPSDAVTISYSESIRVGEITVLNPGHYSVMMGSSRDVVVSGLRSISAVQWGDGIDVFCCQDVVLENLFMRNSDDCVAMYQHRWDYYGDSRNITLRDSSLWADVAHPLHIGLHGNTVSPELMEDVTVSNIDILDHREPQVDYQGCLAINCGDENLIKDILFEDIRVEDFRLGMLLSFKVLYNQKYNLGPGRGIQNVTVRNLSYNGVGGNTPAIAGYKENRSIQLVDFQGLEINGEHIWDGMQKPGWYSVSDFVPMYIGSHVANLTWSA
ncbi:pectin lyase fold/virulence factor [Aspergillus tetrazonus]